MARMSRTHAAAACRAALMQLQLAPPPPGLLKVEGAAAARPQRPQRPLQGLQGPQRPQRPLQGLQGPQRPLQDLEGLQPATLAMLEELDDAVLEMGIGPITVTSGYRSPAYQRQLQARWDAGNRSGLVVRPADSSAHSRGEAVDISLPDPADLAKLGPWARRNGYLWGGDFRTPDPVHFALLQSVTGE